MPSRTQNNDARWLESQEARLNPPLADDEDFVDPFAGLPDGDAEQVRKLRLLLDWTPPREVLH
ncbi:hypothetical protein SNE35_29240 [Paucibacter sp. R3-3]|uniref:Uncharacterized protein n=1 Tax=Roseateles agri TaxID=3098619 RepID=A0ABU5DQN5_9BURK|nr:hypothetical protein [Paucibacter sp. R3-3]MDY0748618.1 hypothetical protein [Paucibacter sp. R3-3]